MAKTTLTDLPLDILVLIFPYLSPFDFLNLCSTCQGLAQPSVRYEPSYWHSATKTKFRVPNRPAAQSDGLRWQHLYKRLHTQSRVYTWGQNAHGCLGNGIDAPTRGTVRGPRRTHIANPHRFGARIPSQRNTWPEEVGKARDLGIIADLQCGGWSTSVLTDKGVIHTVGILDGINQWHSQPNLGPLRFPAGYPQAGERYEAKTAIEQFSSGRTHILGLSDNGTIWSWDALHQPAWAIKLSTLEGAAVTKVVSGWNKSSALLRGTGIVLWEIQNGNDAREQDTKEVSGWKIMPNTGFRRPKRHERGEHDDLADTVGEVTGYIVLEHWVVFVTDLEKAFASRINNSTTLETASPDPLELCSFASAKDVQGSFRNFAIFTGNGEVLIADQAYLSAAYEQALNGTEDALPEVKCIPALQNTGVVQLAFGDYHYHALHSDGSITSYGVEPGDSGALGLGGAMDVDLPHGMLRGIKTNPHNRDGILLPHGYFRGRKVWFQREKEQWIRFLAAGGRDKEEATERMRTVGSLPSVQGEISEWIEQQGNDWDKRPAVKQVDEDGLGAHFALSVAAAGWHSGALVLVNDDVVQAVRESCLVDDPNYKPEPEEPVAESSNAVQGNPHDLIEPPVDHLNEGDSPPKGKKWIWHGQDFPRLKLDGGSAIPGSVAVSEWKEEKPDWGLRWTGNDNEKVFGVAGWRRA